jgi:hypothetical protein
LTFLYHDDAEFGNGQTIPGPESVPGPAPAAAESDSDRIGTDDPTGQWAVSVPPGGVRTHARAGSTGTRPGPGRIDRPGTVRVTDVGHPPSFRADSERHGMPPHERGSQHARHHPLMGTSTADSDVTVPRTLESESAAAGSRCGHGSMQSNVAL